ncbi:MAG: adenylate kinase [Bacilli bacterium]|nr:adenylate kinase [Bacilli bacterium]MDD4734095.1 adenylate kinase [Bacilli bacterium]
MKSIIFIAPPAAGKGTQAELVSKKYGIPNISTGDLLRDIARQDNELGKAVKKRLDDGLLIEDEIVLEILKNRLNYEDCKNGYILDGFPRTVVQAERYEEILKDLNKDLGYVILLDVDKEIAKKRIVGRLSCPTCKSVYNNMFEETMPKELNKCDRCQSELVKRSDDNDETFEERYIQYLEKTSPLIDYYKNKKVLRVVNSGISKKYTFESIERIIKND